MTSNCVTLIEADTSSVVTKSENFGKYLQNTNDTFICRLTNIILFIYNFLASVIFVVRVFVNSECDCGPYLNRSQMSQIPSTFGSDTIKKVLRESVQHLVDASSNQKLVTDMLKQGDGKVIITGKGAQVFRFERSSRSDFGYARNLYVSAEHENESSHFRLPEIVEESEFWSFLSNFLDDLRCCKNLYSKTSLTGPCPMCHNRTQSELKGKHWSVAMNTPRIRLTTNYLLDTSPSKTEVKCKSKLSDAAVTSSSNKVATTSVSVAVKRQHSPPPSPQPSTGAISSTSVAKKVRLVKTGKSIVLSQCSTHLATIRILLQSKKRHRRQRKQKRHQNYLRTLTNGQ